MPNSTHRTSATLGAAGQSARHKFSYVLINYRCAYYIDYTTVRIDEGRTCISVLSGSVYSVEIWICAMGLFEYAKSSTVVL